MGIPRSTGGPKQVDMCDAIVLARLVQRAHYEFSPAEEVEVRLDGKSRALYRPTVLDAVVERVLSQWLTETLATQWPPQLYSYRAGLSSASAIKAFASCIRKHRQAHPDPRTRGLWVLRRDIKSYGTSIPLDTRLWGPLEAWLALATLPRRALARPYSTPSCRDTMCKRGTWSGQHRCTH